MPSTNIINSTHAAIYVGTNAATKVAYSTDAQLSTTMDPRDITNKDSGGWRELLEGLRSWSMSCSFLYLHSANWGFTDFFSALVARTTLEVYFVGGEVGDGNFEGNNYYYGSAFATSGNLSSPNAEDNVVSDAQFEGTGVLTEGTMGVGGVIT